MLLFRRIPAYVAAALAMPVFAFAAEPALSGHAELIGRIDELPHDFVDHFYNVPLAARVVVDGRYLGEAMLVIGKDRSVQLIHFTDLTDSKADPRVRERVSNALATAVALHRSGTGDASGFIRQILFDASTSTLDLVTRQDERVRAQNTYHDTPVAGSGLIVHQRLNIASSGANTHSSRYWIDTLGSVAGWTTSVSAQYERQATRRAKANVSLQQAVAQKELKGHFVRVGRFQPDTIGLYRIPRGTNSSTAIVGVMLGSSDSLRMETGTESVQPIYVTTSRPAVVEVYRQGALIHSQPISAGLQPIDTKRLPGGIYPVEIRVIEDGVLRSSDTQLIYKPSTWTDTSHRFRYNIFAGRAMRFGAPSSWERDKQATMIVGGAVNILLHPRAILGLSAVTAESSQAIAASIDIDGGNWANLYANIQHTRGRGHLADVQWIVRRPQGSLSIGASDAWLPRRRDPRRGESERSWNATGNWRLGYGSQVVARISRSTRRQKNAYELSMDRTISVNGGQIVLRGGIFDRPQTVKLIERRDRGAELTAILSFNQPRHSWSANVGQRAGRRSSRDTYGSAQYQRQTDGVLSQLSAVVSVDRYGVGGSTAAFLNLPIGRADAYLQRSSVGPGMQFGINADNTFAIGGGHVSSTGLTNARFGDALVAVDVTTDSPETPVRANDNQGGSTLLKPGRNILPLRAYAPGRINFDLDARGDATAVLDRRSLDYQANRGSVAYTRLDVRRTHTILGRLLNTDHTPVGGALIEQGTQKSMSEATGIFVIEALVSGGPLQVTRGGKALCSIDPPSLDNTHEEMRHVGDLACDAATSTPK